MNSENNRALDLFVETNDQQCAQEAIGEISRGFFSHTQAIQVYQILSNLKLPEWKMTIATDMVYSQIARQ